MNKYKIALLIALFSTVQMYGDEEPKNKGEGATKKVFEQIDTNGDNSISVEEWMERAAQRGKNTEKAKIKFKKADADKDGVIVIEEFSEYRKAAKDDE